MILPFGEAIRWLNGADTLSPEAKALAKDSLRGTYYEDKTRGYISLGNVAPAIVQRTIERLRKLPPEAPVIRCTRPIQLKGVGWGTYGWKYDHALARLAAEKACVIDTAEGYGFGKVEEELGKALQDGCKALIATKFSRTHMRYDSVLKAYERSRKRLGWDIDIFQLHWPNPMVREQETLNAMGYTEATIGVCNVSLDQLYSMQLIAPGIATVQLRCSSSEITALTAIVLPYLKAANIRLIAHSPFNQGKEKVFHRADLLDEYFNRGIIPIPGTNSLDHLGENLAHN